VLLCDVVDQLLDEHRLADAGAAEQSDLAAFHERRDQVDDLDAGLEHLQLGRLLLERRRFAVNGPALLRQDRSVWKINRLSEDVHHPSERRRAHRHRNRGARIHGVHSALHAVGRFHRDGANAVLAEMLLDFDDDVDGLPALAVRLDVNGVVDLRQLSALEFQVHDGANHLDDLADFLCYWCCCHLDICALFSYAV
jgi:hypothetical protein